MSLFDGPVIFVDVETTGGHPGRCRVIEIGLVAARNGELECEWSTLINPGMPIPPSIQHFTGITDEMVRQAPFFEDLVEDLAARLEGRLFVAHNARFDYGFLRQEFRRTGRKLNCRVACTVKLSRHLYPDMAKHNLDALVERHGLQCAQRHRALPDAQALWQFWQVLRAQRSHDEVEDTLARITYLKSVPPHLPQQLADDLPEGPGVYRFYGENDGLLYVGKANSIRQRVLQHWQGATGDEKSQRLAELTRRVEWTETAGELGALLLESRLIREMRPIYNRALRGGYKQVWTWVVADDGAAPELAPLDQWPLSFEHSDVFGLFKNEASARKALLGLAREEQLCLKMLGLEKSLGSCFAYQLGKCRGACVGKEDLRLHAMRLKLALMPHKMKAWPFPGPIGIRERSADDYEQVHVIDNWRHIATIEAGDEMPGRRQAQPFDLDVYKILLRYFKTKARPRIVEIPVADLEDASAA
jgi:DNA polymerase III subunit epsilon